MNYSRSSHRPAPCRGLVGVRRRAGDGPFEEVAEVASGAEHISKPRVEDKVRCAVDGRPCAREVGVVASARNVLCDRVVLPGERRDLRGERRELVARLREQRGFSLEPERQCLEAQARLREPENDCLDAQKLELDAQRGCFEAQKLELKLQRGCLDAQKLELEAQRESLEVEELEHEVQRECLEAYRECLDVQNSEGAAEPAHRRRGSRPSRFAASAIVIRSAGSGARRRCPRRG